MKYIILCYNSYHYIHARTKKPWVILFFVLLLIGEVNTNCTKINNRILQPREKDRNYKILILYEMIDLQRPC